MSITIKHLEGPLAGQEQSFGDGVSAIAFGRDPETCQIVYPPECDIVGRQHFQLKRTPSGDYTAELFGKRYVAADGTPIDSGAAVKSGSTFRLGRHDGPAFKVEVKAPLAKGLAVTAEQEEMLTSGERLAKLAKRVGAGFGAAALVLLALFGYNLYVQRAHDQALAKLMQDFAVAEAAAAERAKKEFSASTIKKLEDSVYLVARKEGDGEKAEGTAWAFAPGKLATNAHVTEAIKGHEDEFFLIAPDGKSIPILAVVSHPGYAAFKSYKATQGTTRWGNFTPLNLINEYDVGVIEIDPATPLADMLELASQDYVEQLAPGTPVASIGFPVEGLAGSDTATKAPATLHFGHISALTDVFMCRADPAMRLLIQHSVPVTGGASGSPLIDPSGKVIGIVNGGNTTVFKDQNEAMNAKVRLPNAALINYAQRIDLLADLAAGKADEELTREESYWSRMAAQFDSYFASAAKAFTDLAKERYAVADAAQQTEMGNGTLDAGKVKSFKLVSKSYSYQAEPGRIYGFIADAESGVPVGINVKKAGTSEFLRDAKDPRQTSELELAPTAWVTVSEPTELEVIVWSLLTQPAKYKLHAYSWPQPKTASGS
jgi:hypothetical protein